MIGFKDFLIEIFNGTDIYSWKEEKGEQFSLYKFDDFTVGIERSTLKDNNGKSINKFTLAFQDNTIESGMGKMHPTKKHDLTGALKVYNTIIDIIRAKIKPILNKGDYIFFESINARTTNVYDRFAKMITKEINGKYTRFDHRTFKIEKL